MTQITHVTACSQNHLGWELELAPCQYSSPVPEMQNSEQLKDLWEMLCLSRCLDICPVAQTKTNHCTLGPCISAMCFREGGCRSKHWHLIQLVLVQICLEQWKVTEPHNYPDLLPLCTGHKPSKQTCNTTAKLYLGSRRKLRKFHSRPISPPGLWLAPESAFWLLLVKKCRKESVCRVYWPD